jgi:hypothetical protein
VAFTTLLSVACLSAADLSGEAQANAGGIVEIVDFTEAAPPEIVQEADASQEAEAAQAAQVEEAPPPVEDSGPEATLTVQQATVEVSRAGADTFEEVADSAALRSGDTIRTGEQGVALVVFFDETQTTLYPNSELVISTLEEDDDGKLIIQLEQLLGVNFHIIDNFPDSIAVHDVSTPYGVASVRGTAYWSEVNRLQEWASFDVTRGSVDFGPFGGSDGYLIEAGRSFDADATGNRQLRDLDLRCEGGTCFHPYIDQLFEEGNLSFLDRENFFDGGCEGDFCDGSGDKDGFGTGDGTGDGAILDGGGNIGDGGILDGSNIGDGGILDGSNIGDGGILDGGNIGDGPLGGDGGGPLGGDGGGGAGGGGNDGGIFR